VWLGFDFKKLLVTGQSISGVTFTVRPLGDLDTPHLTMLLGSPIINGTEVAQEIQGGAIGVGYRLTAAINVAPGGLRFVEGANLEVIEKE